MFFDQTLGFAAFQGSLTTFRRPHPFQTAREFFKDFVVRVVLADLIPDWRKAGQVGILCLLTWWRIKTARPRADQTAAQRSGSVAEWFKALVLKTSVGGTPPWVRIPPLPPIHLEIIG